MVIRANIQTTDITFKQIHVEPDIWPCPQCELPCVRAWSVQRAAIDLCLDGPLLLLVHVGVYRCETCCRYFRATPAFLRHRSVYTNRVVDAAISSFFDDGLPAAKVSQRMARDFFVHPSEATIRFWARQYAQGLRGQNQTPEQTSESFSGLLCVDEIYQGKLALLVAVDPRAPGGDRLVAFALMSGSVTVEDMEAFLGEVRSLGLDIKQLITDGSSLYPSVVAKLWPQVAHQLCLFHKSRDMTKAVQKAIKSIRKQLPQPPKVVHPKGRLPKPVSDTPLTASDRRVRMALVHKLRSQGQSIKGIARNTGHSKNTVKAWLCQPDPRQSLDIKEGLLKTVPREELPVSSPPEPWTDWRQVTELKRLLKDHRFLLGARLDKLDGESEAIVAKMLASPLGEELGKTHQFAQRWYRIWWTEGGTRRTRADAQKLFDELSSWSATQDLEPLAKFQQKMDQALWKRLSPFLDHPDWQATSNGAERVGRAFRHLQAGRFKFRTKQSMEDALLVFQNRQLHPPTYLQALTSTRFC